MRTPGLVARLMGLESMPTARQNKDNNGPSSGTADKAGEKVVDGSTRFGREELNLEKGETKQELRPQKLQKIGLSERRQVTRFGTEALQLKNVLSRSKKHHQQKLVSPVKSPRSVSGKNASRLIGAATRILEPGLQRSRTKGSLTYSNEYSPHPKAQVLLEEAADLKTNEHAFYLQSSANSSNKQSSSCRNCGHVLDIADIRPHSDEKPSVSSPTSQIAHLSDQVSEKCNPRLPIFTTQREMERNKLDPQLPAVFGMKSRQACTDFVPEKKFLNKECRRQWQASSPQFKLQKDSPSVYARHKFHGENQISQGRDRLPSRPKISRLQHGRVTSAANAINEAKDFVALNQNISDSAQLRIPVKVDGYCLDTNQKTADRRHDSSSPVRKRRSVDSIRQIESPYLMSSSLAKTNSRHNTISGKDRGRSSHSARHLQESLSGDNVKNNADDVSFTFKSSRKRESEIHSNVEVCRNQNVRNSELVHKTAPSTDVDGSSLRKLPLTGDSLGALLEQKLKELTCQEEDDCAFGHSAPKKTTAMILQELISALTTEKPCHRADLSHGDTKTESCICDDAQHSKRNASTNFQAKRKSSNNSAGNLLTSEHLSPGSVLEPCFSNDSCCSSSLDDSSRYNGGDDCTECHEEPMLLEPDKEFFDSVSSPGMGKFYRNSVVNLLDKISEAFVTLNLDDLHLKGSKLVHAKEVILNAELIFGNAALPDGVLNEGFSISNFVLDQLDMLASVMWRKFSAIVGLDTKAKNQLKGFVLDCFVEYLESRFSRYSNTGFNAWTRLPLRMKTEMLICEIVEEIGRWLALAGLFPDELIEHDMSHSLGKWTDFELEAFETGTEIDQQILQALISEMLLEFTGFNPECVNC
ncbi:OLC1v1010732C1 [Oldenlandia corymbosa var. corymbosa]|nr:OLC1v1010732C1 [Oldenlandia corymbosa var. corymbosa]